MDILELKTFFASAKLPQRIRLDRGVEIVDVEKFVESQFLAIDNYGIDNAPSYLERLFQVKNMLENTHT